MSERLVDSSTDALRELLTVERLLTAAKAASLGTASGCLTFVFAHPDLIPRPIDPIWIVGLLGVVGAYAHPLANDLSRSVSLLVWAGVVGLAVHLVAWFWPLTFFDLTLLELIFIPAYSGTLGAALIAWMVVFPTTVGIGYLTFLLIRGTIKP